MYKIKIPKILFLALDIAKFYRNNFFNTNDLAKLANRYKKDLVRQRADKKDYKYLEDTRFGGLRGNFSTLLTWQGLVKRGSSVISSYSIGKDKRLVNAIYNGKIILNHDDLFAYTNDEKLKIILEKESWLFNIRESQAHVKIMLKRDKNIPLERDIINFPKEAIFKSRNNQYFIRGLVNNFVDFKNNVLQYNIINLWMGKKFHAKNIHPLIVIPTRDDPWSEIYAIRIEDLYESKPILLNVDLITKKCLDKNQNEYKLYPLEIALEDFSKKSENIKNRLAYSWEVLRKEYCEKEVDYETRQEDEFSNFLRIFLDWNRNFVVDGKEVVDVKVISSGGPDVELVYSGGTVQKLELEHEWKNYLDHKHQNNSAFNNVWIFAEERFDKIKILKIFSSEKEKHRDRIPNVFLCVDKNKKKRAYRALWEKQDFQEIDLKFR